MPLPSLYFHNSYINRHFTGEIKTTLEYRKQEKEMEAMMKRKKKTEKKDTVQKKTKKNKKVSSTRMLINTKTITDYRFKTV